ncbi:Phosphotransferase [Luteimonas sp. 9C]|uniref:phosphotransferase n=1 Tax=Luteimonas sp. 9C TaxID=2653148 RepID=UPI0012EFA456|nr:phosphotransferase [Luteimonas sp. 9C]VXC12778.1 Phosphotransferase [Luteimonas sp. 9C]
MSHIDRQTILSMIPHQGAMCLWDAVTAWDAASVTLRSASHRDPANPLRSDGQLRALHLCEYGAQAMAVHGGLRAQATGAPVRPGMLVALRGMQLHVGRIDDLDGDLECVAEVLVESDDSQQYAFRITCDGALLADGRAAVMLGPARSAA